MSNILEDLLGPRFTPAQNAGGPASPYNIMPRHLNIPNVGGGVPVGGTPIPNFSTTPVNFPTYTPTNPLALTPTSRFGALNQSVRSSVSTSPAAKAARFLQGGGGRISKLARGAGLPLALGLAAGPVGSAVGGQGQDTPGFDRRDVGQFTSGAMTGASFGRLAGGYGALAGGLVGGVGNALGLFDALGGPKDDVALLDPKRVGHALDDTMAGMGLSTDTRKAIRESTLSQLELAATDAEKQQVVMNAEQTIMQQAMAQEQSTQQLAHSLALQAQAAQIFEPYAEANQRNADMARVLFDNASQNLPENQRYLAAQFALGAQQQSDALTQQMMTTAIAQPRLDALIAQQQQIEGVAAQLVQQAMAGAMAGGQSGDMDVAALLESL